MAEKDIAEKLLLDHDDVFADIINVLLFDGEEVVKAGSLSSAGTLSQYKADTANSLSAQERDIAKFWEYGGRVRFAFFGLENQSDIDRTMPMRVISYDGASYRTQLLRENDEYPYYPVIMLVLYFGTKTHWNRPKSLYDCLKVPERLNPYVSDYKINVFEIAWLDDETVAKFKSDFKIIADYHVQTRKNDNYVPTEDTIKHLREFGALMKALVGDQRFSDMADKLYQEKREVTMCEYLDRLEARGEVKGIAKGKWSIIEGMLKNNLAIPVIAACSDFPVEDVVAFARSHGYTPVMG